MDANSGSFIQNINNRSICICENKYLNLFDEPSTWYQSNLFICKYNNIIHQRLINKRENVDLQPYNDHLFFYRSSTSFIKYINDIDNVYETNDEYNPNKQRKILVVFNDIIACMFSDVKRQTKIIIYKRYETEHFSCFHHTILFCCAKKC